MSETPQQQTKGIGPEIDPEELDALDDTPDADAGADEPEQPQPRARSIATGRTSQFVAPLRSAADADAISSRIAHQALVALQRGEADAIEVTVREAVTVATEVPDDDG